MAEISAVLANEVLNGVQRDISQIKGELGEMKQEMQALRLSQNAMCQAFTGVNTDLASTHSTRIRYEPRLDRIERRLEFNEAPTL